MKKTFSTTVIILLIFFTANAQTGKGNWLIGGQTILNFLTENKQLKSDTWNSEQLKNLKLNLAPHFGYFVVPNLAIGFAFPISYDKTENLMFSDGKRTNYMSNISIAPFTKYYFGESNIKPFIDGAVGIGNYKYKWQIDNDEAKEFTYSNFNYNLGGGVALFFNETASIEFELHYYNQVLRRKETTNNYREISNGFNASFGVFIFIN